MDNPEKNRVAKAVVDRWCSFQEALGGTKRKYPTREFLSFAEAARSYTLSHAPAAWPAGILRVSER
jgi:hypothetical protein